MNIFAGNFSTQKEVIAPEVDYDVVQISERNFFIMWGIEELQSLSDIRKLLEKYFWSIEEIDISIDLESELEILTESTEGESYECVAFEWPNVEFTEIRERFADSGEALCIREAEKSQKYGNRIVKIDFLY